MAYVRAVWYEESSDKTYSGVAPSNWIIDKTLYWPPAIKEASSFKRRDMPNIKTWTKFLLIKEKLRTDDLKIAQNIQLQKQKRTTQLPLHFPEVAVPYLSLESFHSMILKAIQKLRTSHRQNVEGRA